MKPDDFKTFEAATSGFSGQLQKAFASVDPTSQLGYCRACDDMNRGLFACSVVYYNVTFNDHLDTVMNLPLTSSTTT